MSEFRERLSVALNGFASVTPEQAARLEDHYGLLEKWNQRLNLSAIRALDDAVVRHYAECVYFAAELGGFARELGFEAPQVADVGSGPGFPGVPIAVIHPAWKVTLIESHARKAVFLREATRELANVRIVNARAESVPGAYDIVVARAVDPHSVTKLELADNFGLLLGADDVPRETPGRVVKLPWGDRRVAWFFSVCRPSAAAPSRQ